MIKQLKKIQSLMLSDIFYVDYDINDDIDGYYDNDDMYNGITKAIELLKGGK